MALHTKTKTSSGHKATQRGRKKRLKKLLKNKRK